MTSLTRAVSRSLTRLDPLASRTTDHGVVNPWATTAGSPTGSASGSGVRDGDGDELGDALGVGTGSGVPPLAHAASTATTPAVATTRIHRLMPPVSPPTSRGAINRPSPLASTSKVCPSGRAGGWASWSSPEESLAKRKHCYPDPLLRDAWDYLVRRLDRA